MDKIANLPPIVDWFIVLEHLSASNFIVILESKQNNCKSKVKESKNIVKFKIWVDRQLAVKNTKKRKKFM